LIIRFRPRRTESAELFLILAPILFPFRITIPGRGNAVTLPASFQLVRQAAHGLRYVGRGPDWFPEQALLEFLEGFDLERAGGIAPAQIHHKRDT